MTPAARASDWVHDELDFAKEHDRDLMPILLQGEKFFGLGPIQFEDLRNGEMPSQQFVMVLRGLVGEGDMLFQMKAHKGQIRSVAYPANNPSMVASAGPEMCVRIWDPGTGSLRREIKRATWPVSFTSSGDSIATGGPGHAVHLWDTASGQLIKKIGGHKKALTSVAISPDGGLLVTGSSDTLEHVWDLHTGALLRTLGGRVKPASPLVIAPTGGLACRADRSWEHPWRRPLGRPYRPKDRIAQRPQRPCPRRDRVVGWTLRCDRRRGSHGADLGREDW